MTQTLTAGVGLKPEHFEDVLDCRAAGLWLEIHPENYLVDGGPRLQWIENIRQQHPVSVHGVSMSLAGEHAPDAEHLQRLAHFVRHIQPVLVSEHLAWSWGDTHYLPDLLPFARTKEALGRIANHIEQVQNTLGRTIAVENPSHYLHMPAHEWDEIDFLQEMARRSGCLLLLDVNNVAVSAHNLGFSAQAYIDRFPAELIAEVHVAGHSLDPTLGDALWIDSHDAPVSSGVWALYERLIARAGIRPTLLERDGNLPPWEMLLAERNHAHAIMEQLQRQRYSPVTHSTACAAESMAA